MAQTEQEAHDEYMDELRNPNGPLSWLGWAGVAAALFWFGGGALAWWLAS